MDMTLQLTYSSFFFLNRSHFNTSVNGVKAIIRSFLSLVAVVKRGKH
jgi:hypothetical protein